MPHEAVLAIPDKMKQKMVEMIREKEKEKKNVMH
jgi:hypothetical protein